jgi:predicted ATPase/DNA-binding winged helix-turn-helix (wHTH) protein
MLFSFEHFELDLDRVELRVDGQPQPVEPQVFDVLAYLVRHRDRMVPKAELLDEVWHSRFVSESALSSRIKSARRALGDDGRSQRLIRTVHGRGYQFVGDIHAAPAPSGTSSSSVSMPRPATPTVGRERDIAEVSSLLDRKQLVTLLGPGGVGKTRLAVVVALRKNADTGTETCFVDLTKVREPELVLELIARELGINTTAAGTTQQSLDEVLRGRSLLLVLDNFEHVVDAAETVTETMRSAPQVQLLVTSRARLRVAGEQVFDVAPLSVDDGAGPADAVTLFVQAATALDPSFRLEPNASDVAAICRMVDGLPLGIELAAGQVRTLPPSLLRARLSVALGSGASGLRGAPQRQQTIPATIDWSLQLLGWAEQRLFQRLGVFAGPVPLEAIEVVCRDADSDVVQALAHLVDQSLVRRVAGARGSPRFALLELLRERARELLAGDEDEAAMVARRHADYFATYVEDLEEHRWTDAASSFVDSIVGLLPDIRAGRAWAHDNGEVALATRITASLGAFWHREGHHVEGRRWVADALANRDELDDPRLDARLRITAGFIEWPNGGAAARRHWEPAVEGFRSIRHHRYLAFSLELVSATYIGDRDSYLLALRLSDEAIELARQVGELPLIASALNRRGELMRVHGDDEGALAAYQEGKAFATAAGDEGHVGIFLNNLTYLADHRGDYEEARRLGCEAVRLAWSLGRRMQSAAALVALAGPELGLGRQERAARLLGAGDEALRAVGVLLHHGDRSEHDRIEAGLRHALGDTEFDMLSAEGANLSLVQAVDLALSAPDPGIVEEPAVPGH